MQLIAIVDIAANIGVLDARIESGAVEREQAALGVAPYLDRQSGLVPTLRAGTFKPIDGGQHLLHLVADHMPAHLVRHPINEFAVRLISEETELGAAGEIVLAV